MMEAAGYSVQRGEVVETFCSKMRMPFTWFLLYKWVQLLHIHIFIFIYLIIFTYFYLYLYKLNHRPTMNQPRLGKHVSSWRCQVKRYLLFELVAVLSINSIHISGKIGEVPKKKWDSTSEWFFLRVQIEWAFNFRHSTYTKPDALARRSTFAWHWLRTTGSRCFQEQRDGSSGRNLIIGWSAFLVQVTLFSPKVTWYVKNCTTCNNMFRNVFQIEDILHYR